jgi:tRNA-specific 2-thiouridylase
VGQRPFSQNRQSLGLVERDSGLAGLILRPLSARLLDPTRPEDEGLVDRGRLLDISGRSRKRQLELAAQYGITEYSPPAGGCLLTVPSFAGRLRDLLRVRPEAAPDEVELIKAGRYFSLENGVIVIIGRNQADNDRLRALARAEDTVVKQADRVGPTALILGGGDEAAIRIAGALTARLSRTPDDEPVEIELVGPAGGGRIGRITVRGEEAAAYLDRLI